MKKNWGVRVQNKELEWFLERKFWFLSIIVLDQNSPMSHPL